MSKKVNDLISNQKIPIEISSSILNTKKPPKPKITSSVPDIYLKLLLKIDQYTGQVVSVTDERNLNQTQLQNISKIRYFCSDSIQSAGLDESTQQNAALGIYPPERCEAIKSYIAACRNEYLRCKELILAATTNDEADAVQFVAPPVPEGL